jgi:tetratricopeptide (TPR) repeat protein
MNSQFNQYFWKHLKHFKAHGAADLKSELPELIRRANCVDANTSFLYFVADICIEFNEYNSAVELLKQIESRFILDDTGYNILAFCLWRKNCIIEAYFAYKKSFELKPDNISSLRGACYLGIETDNNIEAVEYCRRFSCAVPQDKEAAIWYATALWNANLDNELVDFISQREREYGFDAELHEFLPAPK